MLKEIIERRTGLKLKDLPKTLNEFGGHEVGKTYYCNYWQQTYKVIEICKSEVWGWIVVCKWQDGRITSHCTSLKPGKDFEVLKEVER